MKRLNKKFIVFLLFAFSMIRFYFAFAEEKQLHNSKNIILIGWDGVQREHLLELLSSQHLPNLKKLIGEGSLIYTEATTGTTETKPGWVEILSGYSANRLEVYNNRNYKPIPEGYTIFERLETLFGLDNIATIFIGGKINNIGSRGPHEICINCISRDLVTKRKTFFWDKRLCKTKITYDGNLIKWVYREGEPYFNSKKATNFHLTSLGSAKNVAKQALVILDKYYNKPFFAFFHFEEPDEQGHLYGENSLEYSKGIKIADYWLGVIMKKLKALGIYDKTTIFVTSDHGTDEGGFGHENAPHMFLATNSKRKLKDGDRKDVTPTILEEYGFDIININPPLDGKSLFVDSRHED